MGLFFISRDVSYVLCVCVCTLGCVPWQSVFAAFWMMTQCCIRRTYVNCYEVDWIRVFLVVSVCCINCSDLWGIFNADYKIGFLSCGRVAQQHVTEIIGDYGPRETPITCQWPTELFVARTAVLCQSFRTSVMQMLFMWKYILISITRLFPRILASLCTLVEIRICCLLWHSVSITTWATYVVCVAGPNSRLSMVSVTVSHLVWYAYESI